ncbi:MAG TPA: hypothetical protein VGE12_21865 [Noviherbaspirillum sp.]
MDKQGGPKDKPNKEKYRASNNSKARIDNQDAYGRCRNTTADFMAGLRRQEAAGLEMDIAAGCLVSSDELCRRLNLTKDALAAALINSQIFAVTDSLGKLYFPAFFGEPEKYPLVALEKVCMARRPPFQK